MIDLIIAPAAEPESAPADVEPVLTARAVTIEAERLVIDPDFAE